MMYKILFMVLAIIFVNYLPSYSQQNNNTVDSKSSDNYGINFTLRQLERNSVSNTYLSQYWNQSTLTQFGNANSAFINQVNSGNAVYDNIGSIYEFMQNNTAEINQVGRNNKSLIEQAGTGNQASISINGDNNNTEIFQIGNYNQAAQDITGDSKLYILNQTGNNNTFIQIGNNETINGYKVYQTGNGMNLKILNGRY